MSQSSTSIKVLIMAGGTGGHVFPALAAAKELQARGCTVDWFGTRLGIEAQIVPAHHIPIHYLTITGIRGKGFNALILAPGKILLAVWQAKKILRVLKPNVVLGMGGYASGPGGIAARILGIPLVIHEQNARPGTTNKWLAKIATRVLTAFPNVFERALCIGNPVRAEITQLAPPEERFKNRCGPLRLLILGGSLGAKALNELVPQTLAQITTEGQWQIKHQTGKNHLLTTQELYRQVQVNAEVVPFIDDMAAALGWADLVVCRSGALTVSELSAAGVGSILIPFPHAIDDHQTANANWLVSLGAAVLYQQNELTIEVLKELLTDFANNRDKILVMASAARSGALPAAAQACADCCLEVVNV